MRSDHTLTRLGYGVAITGPIGVVLGVLTGWVEALAAGVSLITALVVAELQARGVASYHVEITASTLRVALGEATSARVSVVSRSRRRVSASIVEVMVGDRLSAFEVPALRPGAGHVAELEVPTHHRAVVTVGPATTVRTDALGLVRRRRVWSGRTSIFVHPRTVSAPAAVSGQVRDLEGRALSAFAEANLAFHALRAYTPGDDVRRIHWRSTARTGRVVVRQDEDVRRTRTALVLAMDEQEYRGRRDIELAVSVFASIAAMEVREGRGVVAVAGRELPVQTPTALLDALCAVDPRAGGESSQRAASVVRRIVPDASLVVVVTGAAAPPAQVRAALSHIPGSSRRVAIVCRPGAGVTVRSWGADVMVRLGDLSELPGLTRRISAASVE
ncbi:DUF58 domain-containing protein [Serinibacter salmoneus]|uniref:Uncharacterized protein (DUF58 family) n=1 Tax=Serinibacter salmoneus TaxID=556530 RepID=A0A2A9D234_9MICO|nr:DUF58 domain-containing protein [Serinibacter salmoneus]PFG20778.1 uncharacterized protein (DUF58 family) [Serinibacter salmoneus]